MTYDSLCPDTGVESAGAAVAPEREDLNAHIAALTRLHQLAMQLSQPLELRPALAAILQTAVDLHGAGSGLLSRYDPEQGTLVAGASLGFGPDALKFLEQVKPGPAQGACGSAFATRQRAIIADTETDPRFECYRTAVNGFRAVHSTPIQTRAGETLGVLSVYFENCRRPTRLEMQLADMCARQAAEVIEAVKSSEAVRESERRYRELIQALPAAVYATDKDGRVTIYNQAAVELWGRAPELGRDQWCGSHKMYWPDGSALPLHQCPMAIAIQQNQSLSGIEAVVERPDGIRRNVLAYPQVIRDSSGAVAGATNVLVDITERKESEQQLAAVKDQLAVELAGMQRLHEIGTRLVRQDDLRSLLPELVGAAIAISGADRGSIQLPDPSGALRIEAHRGFEPAFLDFFGRIYEGQGACGIALQTGERVIVEDIVNAPIYAGTPALDALLEAGVRAIECTPLVCRSGRVLGVMSTYYCRPYRPDEHELRLLDLLARQATDLIEKIDAEDALRERQKLESVGLLAGGIAHDFNNILVGVLGNANLVGEMLEPDSPARPLLNEIELASERAAHLTRQMLAYAGKAQFVIESVDLSDVARETVYLAQASIPKSVSLHLDLAESLPAIQADRSQVQQVVLNLVLNAAEAIGDRSGRISIRTAAETIGTRPFRSALGGHIVAPGRYASIEITDTGCGMDDKTRSRIFDPFFTTKFTGRGLGLAAVAGVVRGHKGAVRVTSAPGKGTKFTVLFPASGDCVRRAKVPDFKVAEPQPGCGGILVVDDEPMVLRTAKIALERRGYRVFVADSGPSAIELIEKDGDAIDLVLLDLSMPGMSGEETFLQLQKRKPGVRALISSGYSELEMRRHFSGQKIAGFVQKPYTALGLAEYVKSALT